MEKAKRIYEDNIKNSKSIYEELSKKVSIIGWSRLLVVLIIIAADYIFYKQNNIQNILIYTAFFAIVFLILAVYHNGLYEKRRKIQILIDINEDGLKRLNGEFRNFEDCGKEYMDENHSYINDLDIFGKNSVFQLINTTITKGGRDLLANILKGNLKENKDEIVLKQEAIKELGNKINWRQKIIVDGTIKSKKDTKNNNIDEFIGENTQDNILRMAIAVTFIIVTLGSLIAAYNRIIPESFILLNLAINFIVLKILKKGIDKDINSFKKIKKDIKSYSNILPLIEGEEFETQYLNELKNKLIIKEDGKTISCSEEIKGFSRILDWIGDSEGNAYYLLINLLFFTDIFLMRRIEKWKKQNSKYLKQWLSVMYEIDALSSISNLSFEHQDWTFPNISSENIVEGINISHPLLGKKGVKNSFELHKNERVALITGSNMSGKSTFLRTVSLNLILAYIGAPVCAEEFSCGIMKVYTCMRTKDNLEENISSFYAEILRIKLLIEACKNKENVFFVLDEIFKGTNSKDRHIGATVLIKQLIKYGGTGLVSTHDLELCDLEKEDSRIVNYNFREFYENNKIKFDYKLRKGKSETQNAIHLMKLAGINID